MASLLTLAAHTRCSHSLQAKLAATTAVAGGGPAAAAGAAAAAPAAIDPYEFLEPVDITAKVCTLG